MLFTFDGLLALIQENRVKANSTFLATISSAV